MANIKFISEWEPVKGSKRVVYLRLIENNDGVVLRAYEDNEGTGKSILSIGNDGTLKLCQLNTEYSKEDYGIEVDDSNYPCISKHKTIEEMDKEAQEKMKNNPFFKILEKAVSSMQEKEEELIH